MIIEPGGLGWGRFAGSILQQPADIFPLTVSGNSRYLVDQTGTPFLLKADAGWMVANHLGVSDQDDYLDHLVATGYNATILMNVVKPTTTWPTVNEPADAAGVQPFTTTNVFSTANDAYFDKVANYVLRAKAKGIVVLFFACYSGAGGGADGWESTMVANTNAECSAFGAYLAGKIAHTNVIPMFMGDRTASGTALTRYQNFVSGWQGVSRTRLCGSELDSSDTLVTDQTGFTYGTNPGTSDMQINSWYGAGPSGDGRTYDTALRAWDNSPTLPSHMEEPVYENAWYNSNNTRSQLRAAHHWARTSGACGTVTGVHGRWQTNPVGNESALSSQGGSASWRTNLGGNVDNDAAKAFAFYSSLTWWLLAPSGTAAGRCGRLLIVSSNSATDSAYISSSLASDGKLLLAYPPPTGTGGTTFSVDLRSMAGNSRARWWNPTSGAFTDITGGAYTLANSLSAQSFTTPGNNGTGTNDWVLVIDAL